MDVYYSTGKKKTAIVRVFLRKRQSIDQKDTINGLSLDDYFGWSAYTHRALEPLRLAKISEDFCIHATAKGSSKSSQSVALSLGLSRALLKYDEELRKILKPAGLLTRDSRIVERKKVGFRKARKKPQFSKR